MSKQFVGTVELIKRLSDMEGKERWCLAIVPNWEDTLCGAPSVAVFDIISEKQPNWTLVKVGDAVSVSLYAYRAEIRVVREGRLLVAHDAIYTVD